MRILAIDYGEKNLGIALSDGLGILAIPFSVEQNNDKFQEILSDLILEKKVTKIIGGFPLSLKGKKGIQAERAKTFFDALSRKIKMDIELIDERFSTKLSEKKLREVAKRNQKDIDKFAAAIILESYLEKINKK